jgi:hypothetical protein
LLVNTLRPRLPTCSPGSTIKTSTDLISCCPGIGKPSLPDEIATVRIELRHTDPLIWREVEVPTSIALKALHDIIQAGMGWFDCHLRESATGKQRYGVPMDDH